jgi:hypothetical protein
MELQGTASSSFPLSFYFFALPWFFLRFILLPLTVLAFADFLLVIPFSFVCVFLIPFPLVTLIPLRSLPFDVSFLLLSPLSPQLFPRSMCSI